MSIMYTKVGLKFTFSITRRKHLIECLVKLRGRVESNREGADVWFELTYLVKGTNFQNA